MSTPSTWGFKYEFDIIKVCISGRFEGPAPSQPTLRSYWAPCGSWCRGPRSRPPSCGSTARCRCGCRGTAWSLKGAGKEPPWWRWCRPACGAASANAPDSTRGGGRTRSRISPLEKGEERQITLISQTAKTPSSTPLKGEALQSSIRSEWVNSGPRRMCLSLKPLSNFTSFFTLIFRRHSPQAAAQTTSANPLSLRRSKPALREEDIKLIEKKKNQNKAKHAQ